MPQEFWAISPRIYLKGVTLPLYTGEGKNWPEKKLSRGSRFHPQARVMEEMLLSRTPPLMQQAGRFSVHQNSLEGDYKKMKVLLAVLMM